MTVTEMGITRVGDHKAAKPQIFGRAMEEDTLLNQVISKYQIPNFYSTLDETP